MDRFQTILKRYWGYDDFRGIQRDIIESITARHDTLGLMPTGGGKSITFQVPALCMEGVCIVITPLIALMKDQVTNLRNRGIVAAAIHSGLQHDDVLRILDNCILGTTKLLYISPERLSSALFQQKLQHMRVSFITVDEAHCISQWGYDFRPSYLKIADIRRLLPGIPVLALTATATKDVVKDIQLRLHNPDNKEEESDFKVFQMSYERINLAYIVMQAPDKIQQLIQLLQEGNSSTIVYVRSRIHAREVAQLLDAAGMSVTFFHAGLTPDEKDLRQREWQAGRIRIIVATNAFGMGIDKADVRLVAHYDCPDSIEAYFQEAGRAGRDGLPARAILLVNKSDIALLNKRINDNFPEKKEIRNIYEHLAYYYQIAKDDGMGFSANFSIEDFSRKFKHFPIVVHAALKILQNAGYIEYAPQSDRQARVRFLVGRDELYRLNGNSPNEDKVIVCLLRNYGGLFADYGFIDESLLAKDCGMNNMVLHETLKLLSRKHIISFIPRSQAPYIRYTRPRIDGHEVNLPSFVYDERKKQYEKRIKGIIDYFSRTDRCRSRLLLEYFGEDKGRNCRLCDVCTSEVDSGEIEETKRKVLALLADRQPHHVSQFRNITANQIALKNAFYQLLGEEIIVMRDVDLLLNDTR